MHKFPPAEQLSFLVGQEIGQICLDPWSLQFRFSADGGISVESELEHVDQSGAVHPHDCGDRSLKPSYLHELVQQTIVAVDVSDFVLILRFNKGSLLRIFSDDGLYECGQIYRSGGPAYPSVVF